MFTVFDKSRSALVGRRPAALVRKLRFAATHVILIDSFQPLKRTVDLVTAGAALAVTAPFSCAFIIKRKMGHHPVLARTERVGRLGRRYTQYSFAGLSQHRILRKIPLLINILHGDMSFIGPRPAAPDDPILKAGGRGRLSVKPGVISPWWLRQRANLDFDDEATVDRQYVNRASLSGDFGIVLRAIPALAFNETREAAPRKVEILGIRIDNLTMAEAIDWIGHRLSAEGQALICMTNAHCANVSCVNPAYQRTLLNSGLNLADGIGVRLAAKIKRTPIRQNVNGTDLFPRLCAMLQNESASIYLLGGRPGVAARVAEWIGSQYPNTVVAGFRDGYFTPGEEDAVTEVIRASGASIVLVAMGVPQQELWIQRNLPRMGAKVVIGVGGLFDFYSGRIPRAPEWMREIGFEWVYRLLQEPGRMWKRYLIGNWTFLFRFFLYELKLYRPQNQATGGS
jgi:N-acetylglucosaminyldiphosphoundecaprenol N-acetyl-beta-D-mannosaminyltransferase